MPARYPLTTMRLIRMDPYPAKARYAALDVDHRWWRGRTCRQAAQTNQITKVHDASDRDSLKLGRPGAGWPHIRL